MSVRYIAAVVLPTTLEKERFIPTLVPSLRDIHLCCFSNGNVMLNRILNCYRPIAHAKKYKIRIKTNIGVVS